MQAQETITSATANLFGVTAAVSIAVAGVVALAFGCEQLADLVEVRVPMRQLMAGRSLQALTLSCRVAWVLAVSRIGPRTARCEGQ